MVQPFAGITVLDCTHVLAGPYCGYQLGLLGADVIRVEPPDTKDFVRRSGTETQRRLGLGPGFLAQGSNKRSLAVDLAAPAGREIVRRLARTADVLVENFRPGVMVRHGLGADDLTRANPRLVYCSITGFGQDGPLSAAPAYDHVVQAISGMATLSGEREGPAYKVGFPVIDYAAGIYAAFAISAALHQRTLTGTGQVIDVAMLDAAIALMGSTAGGILYSGGKPQRIGNAAFSGSPYSGIYATADGDLSITANTAKQARALCAALSLDAIGSDPRATDWVGHPEFAAIAQRAVAAALLRRTATDWELALSAAGIPAGKVRDLDETLAHPQLAGREVVLDVPDVPGLSRSVRVPGVGFKMRHDGASVRRPPPRIGADTRDILRALGMNDAEIHGLEADRVIACADDIPS
jgi:formyl-CoA transferase